MNRRRPQLIPLKDAVKVTGLSIHSLYLRSKEPGFPEPKGYVGPAALFDKAEIGVWAKAHRDSAARFDFG
jgi:predicted DNA-binding transcriptional regulator AlpA